MVGQAKCQPAPKGPITQIPESKLLCLSKHESLISWVAESGEISSKEEATMLNLLKSGTGFTKNMGVYAYGLH
jgi:hypothetical protein